MSEQTKFKLPDNNTGFVFVEVFDGETPESSCLIFHHKKGYLLYVYETEVVLVDMNRGGEKVGEIKFQQMNKKNFMKFRLPTNGTGFLSSLFIIEENSIFSDSIYLHHKSKDIYVKITKSTIETKELPSKHSDCSGIIYTDFIMKEQQDVQ